MRGLLIVVASRCRARALGTLASVVVAHGLSSCGSRALERRLSSCGAQAWFLRSMWNPPGPGLKPASPALAGGFLTTAPPGESPVFLVINIDAIILNRIYANQIQQYRKCIIYHNQIFSRMKDWFNIQKSISVIHRINQNQKKNYMIISIDGEKNMTEFNIPFL